MSASTPVWLAGAPRHTGRTREVTAPWDRRVVARVDAAGPDEVEAALAAGHAAEPMMAALPARARADVLEAARERLRTDRDGFVDAIVHEAGKPITAARAEVDRALDTLTDAAWAARDTAGHAPPLDAWTGGADRVGLVRRVPRGLVVGITPFNFPLNLVLHKIAPAIAAGCPIVLKPAPETPTAALRLGPLFAAAGLPAGALSILPTDVAHAAALVSDPRVKVLSFTGGSRTGWALKQQATRAHVLLELGGNAGVYVAADADVDVAAARIATGGFTYAGQSCISVQRVVVHAHVYDAFLATLVARVRALACGNPADDATVVGPLVRTADADRVSAWVDDALARGAARHTGGGRTGDVVEPVVLTDVPRDARVWCDEVFGPVVAVARAIDDDDALRQLDDSTFGLQAAVFTRDTRLVLRAWDTLHVGAVIHDDATAFRLDGMPYGGTRDSGVGREGPRYAVDELTEPRMLVLRR